MVLGRASSSVALANSGVIDVSMIARLLKMLEMSHVRSREVTCADVDRSSGEGGTMAPRGIARGGRSITTLIMLVMSLLLAAGPVTAARSEAFSGVPRADAMLRELDIVFGTTGLPVVGRIGASPTARELREFVRERMNHDEFYDAVLPRMFGVLSRAPFVTPTVRFALAQSSVEAGSLAGREYYYLDDPCPAHELQSVRPWWNLDEEVLICRDSYRPEVEFDDRASGKQFCEAPYYGNPGPRVCGCGEYLLACARDEAQQWQLRAEIKQEAIRTMQHVIRSRRPFADVLSIDRTVRTDLVEMFYARSEFFLTGELVLDPLT
ncbi:MAG: hypothetical protein KDK70_04790, partial [Myxococcales bacterium]|nr:hypothetical protein [Myxococcales bacterium]